MARPSSARRGRRGEVSVSEFKARCLRMIDEVSTSGREIVLTRNGKPVARVVPLGRPGGTTRGLWKGAVTVRGDIVHGDWSAEFEAAHED